MMSDGLLCGPFSAMFQYETLFFNKQGRSNMLGVPIRSRIFLVALGALVLSVGITRTDTCRRRNDSPLQGIHTLCSRFCRQLTEARTGSPDSIAPLANQAISFEKDSPYIARTKKESEPGILPTVSGRKIILSPDGNNGSTCLVSNCIFGPSSSRSAVLLI